MTVRAIATTALLTSALGVFAADARAQLWDEVRHGTRER